MRKMRIMRKMLSAPPASRRAYAEYARPFLVLARRDGVSDES
jgi:hypothetical protein